MWTKQSEKVIQERIEQALKQNISFEEKNIMGVPASYLDQRIFYPDAPFLKEAPFLMTLRQNPNHIGCHTLGQSEDFFKGTQAIERELIRICAEDIMKGTPNQQDGYVASGGTEANIQAIWTYRNYFQEQYGQQNSIAIFCSEDTHYSIHKAGNLLQLPVYSIKVDQNSRQIIPSHLQAQIDEAKAKGIQQVIIIANMMTTMFGAVDRLEPYVQALQAADLSFKIHIDAAFGGFIYPFSSTENTLNFENPYIDSITLDAHKALQAPYGTGILLIRKGLMQYTRCQAASYVHGLDSTLCGSRSGANAIAVWMIMMRYGYQEWSEKIQMLLERTDYLVKELQALSIRFFREVGSNIITIDRKTLPDQLAKKYLLVPDQHNAQAKWFKIVVMDHVDQFVIDRFLEELKSELANKY